MLGTFRADCYRLSKSFGFWLTQFIIIGVIIITIASKNVGQIGVATADSQSLYDTPWTGVVSVNVIASMMVACYYATFPLLVIIIGHDFSKKTYKNILTVGVSRTTYFISQYTTFALIVLLQVFYVYVVSFVTGTLFYGVGNNFSLQLLIEWLFAVFVQFLMMMAILTICCFVTYLTKSNTLSVITAIFLPLSISIMRIIFKKAEWLNLINFQRILGDNVIISQNSQELHQIMLTAVITIFIFIGLTLFQFNKSEL